MTIKVTSFELASLAAKHAARNAVHPYIIADFIGFISEVLLLVESTDTDMSTSNNTGTGIDTDTKVVCTSSNVVVLKPRIKK